MRPQVFPEPPGISPGQILVVEGYISVGFSPRWLLVWTSRLIFSFWCWYIAFWFNMFKSMKLHRKLGGFLFIREGISNSDARYVWGNIGLSMRATADQTSNLNKPCGWYSEQWGILIQNQHVLKTIVLPRQNKVSLWVNDNHAMLSLPKGLDSDKLWNLLRRCGTRVFSYDLRLPEVLMAKEPHFWLLARVWWWGLHSSVFNRYFQWEQDYLGGELSTFQVLNL